MRRRRLMDFFRRWPVVVRISPCSLSASFSMSIWRMISRIASAPIWARKKRNFSDAARYSGSVRICIGLICSASSRLSRASSRTFCTSGAISWRTTPRSWSARMRISAMRFSDSLRVCSSSLRPAFTTASSCFCSERCSCVSIERVTFSPFSAMVSSACLKMMSFVAGFPRFSSSCSFTFAAAVVSASESCASCSSI